jgi:thioredoxin-like negative regulator of GroEL
MEELNDPRCEDFYAAAASQGNDDALYQLALFCFQNGRNEEAVVHIKAFLKQHRGSEDEYVAWARKTIQQLCPSPVLAWSKGKRVYAD